MSTVAAPTHSNVVRHLSRSEVEERFRAAEAELIKEFGSVDSALRQEYTGNYPSEKIRLFTEYHGMRFLRNA